MSYTVNSLTMKKLKWKSMREIYMDILKMLGKELSNLFSMHNIKVKFLRKLKSILTECENGNKNI